ncbi:MAG TPA: 3-phosphoshikimate 1-carboxyvinyltransferase [Dehalococcoidia bacterium]|nr:3-phosphoshikimate 1-carboxyvinyltransferase [Dehalococcoidia bacterium]
MGLPDVVEIVPPARPAPVWVTVPGSKSITNRALVLAALGEGDVTLRGALWSEDTEIMVEALRTLGFEIAVERDPAEECNRTITVAGRGGRVPRAGTADRPLEIYVGNAGTVARFLMAMVCLGEGWYRLHGTPRMHERPQAALIDALRQLGYHVQAQDGRLPALIAGGTATGFRSCVVSIEESSQFASALLLSARVGGWKVTVVGEDSEESAYVRMTAQLIEAFPVSGGEFQIEPDCSSASYFLAAGALLPETRLQVAAWPESGWQPDARFLDLLPRFQAGPGEPFPPLSRARDLGDAIMTAIVVAPLLARPSRFVDLGRLRLQESERVQALSTELKKCGARVVEDGDTLEVFPSELRGAEIETYDDHRVAMCFSILGLKVPGMRIRNPACVGKTFPNFFAKLAAPSPAGLGATVLDVRSGRPLPPEDLMAG